MTSKLVDTWLTNSREEDNMFDDHYPLWQVMINRMSETSLEGKTVLDFGCNQGGFLQVLYQQKPFQKGIGIDVARQSIQIANDRKGNLPLVYEARDNLDSFQSAIDIAFSHEVLYLIRDLKRHSQEMYTCLQSKGTYYAALGCHADNPLWPTWKTMIEAESNLEVQNYSLNFIADTFRDAGFSVFAQKFMLNDFILMKESNVYFPNVLDSLNYYWDYKILWKFVKP
ncbi:methyltransferase domain-containing protein [Oculatella sp. LEGE 06141]|uniref:class I SAM-dependent methyltransferase n=1 Tax=Oculatella sp. LEGE 06141 TaxID=1828648 RepID=UPI00187F99E0|nr:methyltransferase domain-containing protein [Oculatella sp. LEGE 06141]MBE9178145.1 methyltransferase domain-containing protein [Oculatella sp. LEGE 06141]